jgi:PBP1b-binding outer membrane lipoprotein LpoB
MKNTKNIILLLHSILILIGCSESKEKVEPIEKDGWKNDTQVIKAVKNVNFTFPAKGFAFDKKEQYVKECFDAIR